MIIIIFIIVTIVIMMIYDQVRLAAMMKHLHPHNTKEEGEKKGNRPQESERRESPEPKRCHHHDVDDLDDDLVDDLDDGVDDEDDYHDYIQVQGRFTTPAHAS